MDEVSPLGVYLVKSGSKGDRLLFRYPYAIDTESDTHGNKKRSNPYALILTEDTLNTTRISDKALSNLFATKSELCNRKFELKVNDVRFVGTRAALFQAGDVHLPHVQRRLALKANASHDIV
uniref:Putative nitrogen permease regulator n=1 Tax=Ixodes ricinus TaxID=34613 RepID=A0A0K8RDA5_IXORI